MIFTLLRGAVLCLCLYGWCLTFYKKGLPMAFAPTVTLTGIGSCLFLAGILNVLPYMLVALLLGGIFLFFKEKGWRPSLAREDWLPLGVFALLSLLFLWRVWEEYPVIYDAFSHWLTVVKNTMKTHSFPNFLSTFVGFQGYPTGTAGFAYFVCTVLGFYRDDIVLFTQALQVAACLVTLLAFPERKHKILSAFVILCTWVYSLIACPIDTVSLCEPLPDTLISLLSLASLAVVVHFRREPEKAAWFSLPIQVFLAAVKNSGLFMLVFNTCLLVYFVRCQDGEKKALRRGALKAAAIHSGIPFLVFFLWNQHVDYVFAHGSISKHTVSMENYRGTLGAKSFGEIFEILELYLRRFFSFRDSWVLLVLCILLFGGIYLTQRKAGKKGTGTLHTFCGIVCCYVVYMMGLALMYLASMDYNEAIGLGSFERYEKTVIIYLVGAIAIYLLIRFREEPAASRDLFSWAGAAVMAVILLTQAGRLPMLVVKDNLYEGSQRQLLEQIKEDYGIPDGARCLLYGPQVIDDWGYHFYLGRYIFWSESEAYVPQDENLPDFDAIQEEFDYLIVMEPDPFMDGLLEENDLPPGQMVYAFSK